VTTAPAPSPVMPVLKRRLRSLTYLAAVTGVAVLLAAVALWQRSSTGEPSFKVERMFADLRDKANDITTIQIETKGAAFNVTRTAQGAWILPDKANYPADFNTIRKVVVGLAELDLVEKRTSRSDQFERLGLSLPKSGGTGTLVTLKNGKGEVLASVIAGSTVEGGSAGGRQAIYVRRPNQNQAYIARGNLSLPADQVQWLDKAFIDLARDRVKTAALKPFKGRPYSVTRAKPEDANFRIVEAIPAGRVLRTEAEPNGIGNALMGLSFDDVAPQEKIDFSNAALASFQTFDGLNLSLKLIEKDREFWITVGATGTAPPPEPAKPGSPATSPALKSDPVKEAKDINAVTAGWAYKIPRYKGTLLTAPLEDLLKPVGSPADPGN